jgi:hypothetical protein
VASLDTITKKAPWEDLNSQIFLGDKMFMEKLKTP